MTQNDLREKVINAEAKVAKRTKHDIDDLVTVVRIIREEAPAWQH